jgi:hypothetical protein
VIDPWNPNRDAQREMRQPGTQQCATELSGNGTLPWHATKPEAKNHHLWIAEGLSWDPYRGQRKPSSHS